MSAVAEAASSGICDLLMRRHQRSTHSMVDYAECQLANRDRRFENAKAKNQHVALDASVRLLPGRKKNRSGRGTIYYTGWIRVKQEFSKKKKMPERNFFLTVCGKARVRWKSVGEQVMRMGMCWFWG